MDDAKKYSINPSTFFLVASLLIGIFYCVAIPYGAGFDEERHLTRIYFISRNYWLPNFPNATIIDDVSELSYQRRLTQTPAFNLFESSTFWRKFSKLEEDVRYNVKTQSIYSPVIFLPQVIVAKILWWRLDFAILPTIILMKIAGLLVYIAGAYIGVRAVPYGKWLFSVLALFPAAMYQAATLNADGFTGGISFAFIGYVIAVYVNEKSGVRPRSVWILFSLSILLGLAKPGAIILLPLLLILWQHHFPSKKWIVILWAGVILSLAANLGWWMIASQGSIFSGEGAQDVAGQSSQILANPFGFGKLLVQSILVTLPLQIQGWIAAYGYWAGKVPGLVYFFAVLALLAAYCSEPNSVPVSKWTRAFFVLLFLLCSVGIYTVAFVPNYVVGGLLALNKQGRYYIPFAPLFFLALAGLFVIPEKLQRVAQYITAVSLLLMTGWFVFGIYTTYYTYCGYDAYMGDKCMIPVYKNLEKEDMPEISIHNGERVSQTFTKFCGNLEMVDVFITSVPEDSAGALKFSLLDENKQIVAEQNFPVGSIHPGDVLTLPVSSKSDLNRVNYEIRLEAQNLSPQESISFGRPMANYYPGEFSVNGTSTQKDLLIHYMCTTP